MDGLAPAPLIAPRLLWRGLRRRCPLCGAGHCFDTFFLVKDRCPRCNFPIRREEGHWIGAIGINTMVSLGSMALAMLVLFTAYWDNRRVLPIILPLFAIAILVPLLFFGSSQTLWSAIDLLMRPLEPADDVDPRWIPPPVKRS